MTTTYDEPGTRLGVVPAIPEPKPDECLCCFLFRTLDDYDCDGALRWAGVWRDLMSPTRTDLERQLRSGGGYCDCEVLINLHWPLREPAVDASLPPCQALSGAEPPIACGLFT